MTAIGVHELRRRAGELLKCVAAGETIEIMERGRTVALLSPVPAGDALADLRAAGEVSTPRGAVDDLPEPLILPTGARPPTAVLARLRADGA